MDSVWSDKKAVCETFVIISMLVVLKHPSADKSLVRFPKKARLAIERELSVLSQCFHPLQHRHIIKLGGAEDRYRMRVGDYRVKMRLRDENGVIIVEIEHRQAGY